MFGSKIRSWMENHIVRPRKKSNKNKSGTNGNLPTTNTQNGHKGNSCQAADSTITSPARRSEVSPIQNHTTSRAGWQSPQENNDLLSPPKSDNLIYRHQMVNKVNNAATTSPKTTMLRNSSYPLVENQTSINTNQHHPQQQQQQHYQQQYSNEYQYQHQYQYQHNKYSQHQHQQQLQPTTSLQQYQQYSKSVDSKYFYKPINELHKIRDSSGSGSDIRDSSLPTFPTSLLSIPPPINTSTSSCSTSNEILLEQKMFYPDQRFSNVDHKFGDQRTSNFRYSDKCNNSGVSTDKLMSASNDHNNDNNNNVSNSISNNDDCNSNDNNNNTSIRNNNDDNIDKKNIVKKYLETDADTIFDNSLGKIEMEINSILNIDNQKQIDAENRYGKILQSNRNTDKITTAITCTDEDKINDTVNNNNNEFPIGIGDDSVTPNTNGLRHGSNNTQKIIKNINTGINPFNHHYLHHQHQPIMRHHLHHNHHHHQQYNGQQKQYLNQSKASSAAVSPLTPSQTSTITTGSIPKVQMKIGSETNRNMLRICRYNNNNTTNNNGNLLSAPGNHQLVHVINSLSSPESAYSTGYSTEDGTSPGASYTPEYYINMRTGTHYFPNRTAIGNSLIDQNRNRFMLNKIEEIGNETIVFNDGGGGGEGGGINNKADSQFRQNDIHKLQIKSDFNSNILVTRNILKSQSTVATGLSPDLQRRLAIQNYKGLESPSPRQRCRIRTNPWFTNIDTTVVTSANGNLMVKRVDNDTSSTSSGIKSSSDIGTDEKLSKKVLSSESESSSSSTETEVQNKQEFTAEKIFKDHKIDSISSKYSKKEQTSDNKNVQQLHKTDDDDDDEDEDDEEDEDATLNEMMGKFDESYCYEKETDILSDSDPTECLSDLDTGQDGGDECDTDELLDIDFIDTGSVQEIIDKDLYKNTGSCSYYNNFQHSISDKRSSRLRRSKKHTDDCNANKLRRKKLTRTRKRSSDCRDRNGNGRCSSSIETADNAESNTLNSSINNNVRESRSLGGTPVSLRRNQSEERNSNDDPITPLTNRCNSLTFTEIHSIRSRFLAIAESEKALIEADLEADIKYKQLIHEAETILVSMKTTGLKETPYASPRRTCNVPTNKRVEMLRNCEADLKRELGKTTQKTNNFNNIENCDNNNNNSTTNGSVGIPIQQNLPINKHIEMLRLETTSAPNSPKTGNRLNSPRKTHITNFIYQNVSPTELLRRKSSPTTIVSAALQSHQINPATVNAVNTNDITAFEQQNITSKMSPQLQVNGRKILSPPKSPTPIRRRYRSQSPRISIDSDTDTETESNKVQTIKRNVKCNKNGCLEIMNNSETTGQLRKNSTKKSKSKSLVNGTGSATRHQHDQQNFTVQKYYQHKDAPLSYLMENPYENIAIINEHRRENRQLLSFQSVDVASNNICDDCYCPQSEPLKRKIYSGSNTLEKLKKSLEMDADVPKKVLLEKISLLRKERQNACLKVTNNTTENGELMNNSRFEPNSSGENLNKGCSKRQIMIWNTLEDLKRNLEDQSIELNGLNEED